MNSVSIRGAITVDQNNKETLLEATRQILEAIIAENHIQTKEIVQIIFTATRDLDAAYPAIAARELGITQAALICMQEMYVVGSLEKCIRVAMLVESNHHQIDTIKHQYLKGASCLRPDLVEGEDL